MYMAMWGFQQSSQTLVDNYKFVLFDTEETHFFKLAGNYGLGEASQLKFEFELAVIYDYALSKKYF